MRECDRLKILGCHRCAPPKGLPTGVRRGDLPLANAVMPSSGGGTTGVQGAGTARAPGQKASKLYRCHFVACHVKERLPLHVHTSTRTRAREDISQDVGKRLFQQDQRIQDGKRAAGARGGQILPPRRGGTNHPSARRQVHTRLEADKGNRSYETSPARTSPRRTPSSTRAPTPRPWPSTRTPPPPAPTTSTTTSPSCTPTSRPAT